MPKCNKFVLIMRAKLLPLVQLMYKSLLYYYY